MEGQDEADRIRREKIEKRAYEIYQARGGQDGLDLDDWLEAEWQIDGIQEESASDAAPEATEHTAG